MQIFGDALTPSGNPKKHMQKGFIPLNTNLDPSA